MSRLVLRFLLAVISPVMLLVQPAAHAQPAPKDKSKVTQAKAYVDAGLAAQNGGDYDTAIIFYNKANELLPHPVLLFNIAQAHRLAGRVDQAVEFYQKFLSTNPTGTEAKIAHDLLAELAKRKAEQARKARKARGEDEPTAEPVPDAAPGAEGKANGAAAGAGGKANGATSGAEDKANDAAAGAKESSGVRASTSSRTQATSEPHAAWSTRRKVAVGMAGGGVLALALGTVLGISAKSKQSDAHDLCPDPERVCGGADSANDLIRAGHDRAIGADVALGLGAAAAITAGVLWFTGKQESPHRVSVVPAVSPGQVVLSASGNF
jgi:Tetratricopeptide repeat